jgi:Uma2 family endonuclease
MDQGLKQVLDYSDYLSVPEDGKRYEIIGGELYVTPTPTFFHQRVSRRLQRQLEDYFHDRGLGEVVDAPVTLLLTNNDVMEPDLMVIGDADQVTDRGIVEGPPVLIVEVLSKSTAARDRSVKAKRYAELGVDHYWLVDPRARRIEGFARDGSRYGRAFAAEGDDRIDVAAWPGLVLDLTALWADSEAPRRGGKSEHES